MKKIKSLFVVLLLIPVLAGYIGCEGPSGPPGDNTVAHLEGFKEGINCGDCHNPDQDTTYLLKARVLQYQRSQHYLGDTYATRNAAPCTGCHSSEGLIQRAMAEFPPQPWSVVTSQPNSSPVGCFTCHSPHSTGDFSLRRTESVVMWSPMEGIPDQSIDQGQGNMCLSCHQTRAGFTPKMKTSMGADEVLTITTSRWYPHYGVQGLMFLGTGSGGGFEFPGKSYTNSSHPTHSQIVEQGCPTCHMAEPSAGLSGGHTMKVGYTTGSGAHAFNTNGCLQSGCHSGAIDVQNFVGGSASLTGGMGVYKYVHNQLDTLRVLLEQRGILNAGGLVNGNNGTAAATSSNPRTFTGPQGLLKAGALYNYYFIEHDASGGIHNSRYTIQLLNHSIEEMRKP